MPRTLISVDRDAGEPLYRQVRKALEHGLAVGSIDPDAPLPSSRQLAKELGLSRNTINTAYLELLAEGFVESHPRRGLFVNSDMRPHCSVEERTEPEAAPFDWNARLRGHPDDNLPHVEKHLDWHRYPYPFIAGQVDVSSFPARAWATALRDALLPPHVHQSLQDSIAADDPMLVDLLCRHVLPSRGIEAQPDQVLLTMGSQQGLHLVSEALLGPDTTVMVEEPGYLDARHIFARVGASLRTQPVDGSGLVPPDDLGGVDLLHLTPSHHHPTNVTLTIGRRRHILSNIQDRDTIVVEDDYDSEFRYQGSPTPALKALDETERVIYLGTFSKFLAPGLRLGYVVGARELIAELRNRRRYALRHPPGHLQRAMALLIQSGEYNATVRRHRWLLQRKWEKIVTAVNTHLPWQTTAPPGGTSLWMSGPPELDCRELQAQTLRRGVIVERGDIFFLAHEHGGEPPRNNFRLGFAAIKASAIEEGVRRISRSLSHAMGG